ncbi:MAG: cobalamin biosynthesis protein CobD, partial [Sphingomonas sp.]
MSHALPLLLMLIAEAAFGYPRRWRHPVVAVGALIDAVERRWNRGDALRQRLGGVALLAILVGLSVLTGVGIERLAEDRWGLVAVLA